MSTQDPGSRGGSGDDPYGQPPPSNPFGGSPGQQPSAQPPPTSPYGGYGEHPSGPVDQPPPYGGYGQPAQYQTYGTPVPDRRPGTVTAACWITWVMCSITALLLVVILLGLLAGDSAAILDQIAAQPGFEDTGLTAGDLETLVGVFQVVVIVMLVLTLLPIVFAYMAFQRSIMGRVLLVIWSGLSAVMSLIGIASGVSIVSLAAAIAVVVLLFTGGASQWYAARRMA